MMDRPKAAAEDLLHPAEPRPIHDGEGPAGSGHFLNITFNPNRLDGSKDCIVCNKKQVL